MVAVSNEGAAEELGSADDVREPATQIQLQPSHFPFSWSAAIADPLVRFFPLSSTVSGIFCYSLPVVLNYVFLGYSYQPQCVSESKRRRHNPRVRSRPGAPAESVAPALPLTRPFLNLHNPPLHRPHNPSAEREATRYTITPKKSP